MKAKVLSLLVVIGLLILNLLGVGYGTTQQDTLTIVTWNIKHGNGHLDWQQEQLETIGADICLLQEVDEYTDRVNGVSTLEILSGRNYYYQYFGNNGGYQNGEYGTGILSKRRFTKFEPSPLIEEGVHNGIIKGTLRRGGQTFSLYNVHLSSESDTYRAKQLEVLLQSFEEDENPCKIIAGDFNIRDLSELALFEEYGIINTDEHYYPTYQGLDWDTQAIDNVIYTDDTLEVQQVDMLVNGLSDHNALTVTFQTLE